MPILEVRSLEKRFGGLRALDGVSFAVSKSDIFGVIGPNGAGKTTLFNVISGLERPENGSVLLDDRDITQLSLAATARRGLVRTFQRSLPFGQMTVLDNLMVAAYAAEHSRFSGLGRRWLGIGHRADQQVERANELLEMTGLAARSAELAGALAHGDLRRLEIARALMTSPRVLLLDEPAAGLSAEELASIAELLRRVRADGITVVLIEHNMTLIMNMCDRIAVLDHGVKIAEGSPGEIQNDQAVVEAYFGRESERARHP